MPPDPTFFADRNLGKEFVRRLRDAGLDVEDHDDHFDQKTKDPVWIRAVTKKDWVILTTDKQIAFDEREIDSLMVAGGRAYLPAGKMLQRDFADLIVRTRARLFRHIKHQKKYKAGAYMAKLRLDPKDSSKPGHVETWVDKEKWHQKLKKRKPKKRQ